MPLELDSKCRLRWRCNHLRHASAEYLKGLVAEACGGGSRAFILYRHKSVPSTRQGFIWPKAHWLSQSHNEFELLMIRSHMLKALI